MVTRPQSQQYLHEIVQRMVAEIMSNHSEKNEKMSRVAPELASRYATYPMKLKFWLDPANLYLNAKLQAELSHLQKWGTTDPPSKQKKICDILSLLAT